MWMTRLQIITFLDGKVKWFNNIKIKVRYDGNGK